MGIHERERTFENITRLCDAERRFPAPEIAEVREDLESQLGGTVPRSFAARKLGVSHTALNKWIASGDVPVVITKKGRREVPIPALLELREHVIKQRSSGRRSLHALEPVMLRARRRAERMRPGVGIPRAVGEPDSHRQAELCGLAYHRVLAPRLRRPMIEQARRKLRRWQREGKIDPRYAEAWGDVFALSMPEIRKAITADDQRGRDLRQNSPFGGLLSEPERRKVLESVGLDSSS